MKPHKLPHTQSAHNSAPNPNHNSGCCNSNSTTPELLPGLPDDIASLVLSRLPRSLLLNLKGVCKSWKSFLEHPQVAETRASLKCVEDWVYVQSWNSVTEKVSWWAFDRRTGKWLRLPNVPRRRGWLSSERVFGQASAVLNGKLFVMGGKTGRTGPTLRELLMYCPLVNRWARRKPMIRTRHSPLVSVLRGKLYVLGGFDWDNQLMHASEVYDSGRDEWKEIESTGHPPLLPPQWYKKDWRPEWQSMVIHNSSYFCSYTEVDGRAFVKEYDPETGTWRFKRPKLKALLRYGLSTVLAGKLHTVDWAAGRVRVADASGIGWIHMKEIQGLPWVQILRTNPQIVGLGSSLFVVKRGLQLMSIDISQADSGQVLRFWDAPTGSGVKDEEVLSCQVLGL